MANASASALGFTYGPVAFRTDQRRDVRRARFRVRKVLEGVVHDTVALEGNPFTLPEVKTLLEGVTVGGHRLEDERQVLNQPGRDGDDAFHGRLFAGPAVAGGRWSIGAR